MAFGRLKIFATHFASSDGSNKKPFLAAPNPQMEKQRQQDLIRALFAKYRKWEIDLRRCSKYKVLNIHQSRKYKKHVHVVLLGIEKAKVNCLFEVQSLRNKIHYIFVMKAYINGNKFIDQLPNVTNTGLLLENSN